jgi:hypothetical protein
MAIEGCLNGESIAEPCIYLVINAAIFWLTGPSRPSTLAASPSRFHSSCRLQRGLYIHQSNMTAQHMYQTSTM